MRRHMVCILLLFASFSLRAEEQTSDPQTDHQCTSKVFEDAQPLIEKIELAKKQVEETLHLAQAPVDHKDLLVFSTKAKIYAWLTEEELEKVFRLPLRERAIEAIENFDRARAEWLVTQIEVDPVPASMVKDELIRLQYFLQAGTNEYDLSRTFRWDRLLSLEQAQFYSDLMRAGWNELGKDQKNPRLPKNLDYEGKRLWVKALASSSVFQPTLPSHITEALARGEAASYRLNFREVCCKSACTDCAKGRREISNALSRYQKGEPPLR